MANFEEIEKRISISKLNLIQSGIESTALWRRCLRAIIFVDRTCAAEAMEKNGTTGIFRCQILRMV
jgi:hypothetical protein